MHGSVLLTYFLQHVNLPEITGLKSETQSFLKGWTSTTNGKVETFGVSTTKSVNSKYTFMTAWQSWQGMGKIENLKTTDV